MYTFEYIFKTAHGILDLRVFVRCANAAAVGDMKEFEGSTLLALSYSHNIKSGKSLTFSGNFKILVPLEMSFYLISGRDQWPPHNEVTTAFACIRH